MWEVWRSTRSFTQGSKERGSRSVGSASPQNLPGTPTALARLASTTVTFKDISIAPEVPDANESAERTEEEDIISEDRCVGQSRRGW